MPNNPNNKIIFSDLDLKFQVHPITGDVPLLKNVDAIKRSVKNLVLTNRFDKPYQPSIYGGVLESLFENFDPLLVMQLRTNIQTVLQFEPRIKDVKVNAQQVVGELDKNGININIEFTPINALTTVSVDVFLQRIR